MPELEKGKDKVKKICDVLRKETLDPAREEATRLLEEAKEKAEQILRTARGKSQEMLLAVRAEIEKERVVFDSSLKLAAKQALLSLKQDIETKLFDPELAASVGQVSGDPKTVASLIEALVSAAEKEGLGKELIALIPKTMSAESVAKHLAKDVLDKLKGKSVSIGDFDGGAELKVVDSHITLEMTDEALKNLIAQYVREDFKEILFA